MNDQEALLTQQWHKKREEKMNRLRPQTKT